MAYQGACYCSSCEFRDLYIRLFDLFVLLGGDVDRLKLFSPIEKVTNYFVTKDFKDGESLDKEDRALNRIMKQLKDFSKVGSSLLGIRKLSKIKALEQEAPQLPVTSKAALRSILVSKLQLISEVVNREKIKFELVKQI